jgi:hypothetical protein
VGTRPTFLAGWVLIVVEVGQKRNAELHVNLFPQTSYFCLVLLMRNIIGNTRRKSSFPWQLKPELAYNICPRRGFIRAQHPVWCCPGI